MIGGRRHCSRLPERFVRLTHTTEPSLASMRYSSLNGSPFALERSSAASTHSRSSGWHRAEASLGYARLYRPKPVKTAPDFPIARRNKLTGFLSQPWWNTLCSVLSRGGRILSRVGLRNQTPENQNGVHGANCLALGRLARPDGYEKAAWMRNTRKDRRFSR